MTCALPLLALLLADVPVLAGGIMVNEPDHRVWAESVDHAGLDTVQVTLYARQGAWDSSDLTFKRDVVALEAVESEMRAARRAGLRVILVLRVYLEHALPENRHLWHGMVWPRDDVLAQWFEAYHAFVMWGADLGRRHDIDLLVVGNELNSMTSTATGPHLPDLYAYLLDPARTASVRARRASCARRVGPSDLVWLDGHQYPDLDAALKAEEEARRRWAHEVTGLRASTRVSRPFPVGLRDRYARLDQFWRETLAAARLRFGGPVSYGANFDQFHEVGFWDATDAVGLTAYFPLSRLGARGPALDAMLRRSWTDVAARVERAAAGRPVVLLELGWTRKAGSTVRPFSYTGVEPLETTEGTLVCVHWGTQPEAPEERVRALWALLDIVEAGRFPSLRGFSLWKLTTLVTHRPIEPFAVVVPWLGLGEGDAGLLGIAAELREALVAQRTRALAGGRL